MSKRSVWFYTGGRHPVEEGAQALAENVKDTYPRLRWLIHRKRERGNRRHGIGTRLRESNGADQFNLDGGGSREGGAPVKIDLLESEVVRAGRHRAGIEPVGLQLAHGSARGLAFDESEFGPFLPSVGSAQPLSPSGDPLATALRPVIG